MSPKRRPSKRVRSIAPEEAAPRRCTQSSTTDKRVIGTTSGEEDSSQPDAETTVPLYPQNNKTCQVPLPPRARKPRFETCGKMLEKMSKSL
ncbi:hypothetical protein BDA96_01G458000 [Sorghum bicolor]|uniref:Uncharacterized protein n=2 Tax=Sorghum bicolor TaxID=4558 RepID=A0A921S5V9_SORBI|nr:hypothetical protein BDA96_01G458000 [Sorghum bicolor]OQU92883.1 hypothetical protein SORBI_3001G429950 [Sorghum bicolor]